jgi:hypothetical protein
VRLDHLLSKEHCPHVCVWCQSPVCPRVWGSGCSRVEHRLFGTVLVSLTSTSRQLPVKRVLRPLRGYGSGTWGMVGAVSDTLLGPEGSDDTRRLELARSPVGGLVGSVVCVGWFFWSWAPPIAWLLLGGVWGAGCILRTSQWTRASL